MAGQRFTTPSIPFAFKKNSGGLNSTSSPLNLEINESSDLQNIDFDRFGSILKRKGYSQLNTTAVSYGGIDSNVSLLLHCNGTDASTTFTDSSSNAFSVTAGGNAQIDTDQSYFGGASGLFDGTGDSLTISDNTAFDFSGGVWTVDCWVRPGASVANMDVYHHETDANNYLSIRIASGLLTIVVVESGVTVVGVQHATSISNSTWTHILAGEDGDTWYVGVAGAVSTATDTNRAANYTGSVTIGTGRGNNYNGHIDELRVSKGVIRQTSNFTPPNRAYNTESSVPAWVGLHYFKMVDATEYLVGVCGTDIFKMDSLDGTWDNITGSLTITAGNNNHVQMKTFRNSVYGVNGVNAPWKWTGTGNASAWTMPTNVTIPKYIEVFQNYLVIGNVTVSGTADPSRAYWTGLGVDTFTDTDNARVNYDDGQSISGLFTLGEELIISKTESIWKVQFTGQADVPFTLSETRSNVGFITAHSVQLVENGLLGLCNDNRFHWFDGNNNFPVSDRITTTMADFEESRFPNCVSAYQLKKNRYWASVTLSAGSTHSRCVTWDSFNNAWGIYKGHNANCFVVFTTGGDERIYFGDYSGYVYRADTGTNDTPAGVSTAIDAYYYTKWFDYDDVVNTKGTPHVFIYYTLSPATVTFAYSYNLETTDSYTQTFSISAGGSLYGTGLYGTATYAGAGGGSTRRDLIGRGRLVRFRFRNATLSETMKIDGFGTLAHVETNL